MMSSANPQGIGTEDDSDWEILPLGHALSGHLMVDIVGAAIALAGLAGAKFGGLVPHASFELLFGGVICGWIAYSTVGTFVDRMFSKAAKHDDPGSWPKAVLLFVLTIPAGILAGLVVGAGDLRWMVFGALAFFFGYGVELAFLDEPWSDGTTRAEVRDKWEQTKVMTKDVFSEEIDDAKRRRAERDGQ